MSSATNGAVVVLLQIVNVRTNSIHDMSRGTISLNFISHITFKTSSTLSKKVVGEQEALVLVRWESN